MPPPRMTRAEAREDRRVEEDRKKAAAQALKRIRSKRRRSESPSEDEDLDVHPEAAASSNVPSFPDEGSRFLTRND